MKNETGTIENPIPADDFNFPFEGANNFRKWITGLKSDSSYYPRILIRGRWEEKNSYAVYMSSLVRIKRDNKWYVVHCVENIVIPDNIQDYIHQRLLERFISSVHKIQHLYKITGEFEDVDVLQEDESGRLTKEVRQVIQR